MIGFKKGQLAPETVIIAAVMLFFLLAMVIVNSHLQQQWDVLRQELQAGAAANQLALHINKAAAGGNGTVVSFLNSVGKDVANMSIQGGRVVRASYKAGGYVEVPTVTNNTDTAGAETVPINVQLFLSNTDGEISITGG